MGFGFGFVGTTRLNESSSGSVSLSLSLLFIFVVRWSDDSTTTESSRKEIRSSDHARTDAGQTETVQTRRRVRRDASIARYSSRVFVFVQLDSNVVSTSIDRLGRWVSNADSHAIRSQRKMFLPFRHVFFRSPRRWSRFAKSIGNRVIRWISTLKVVSGRGRRIIRNIVR